jgi:hypothetical protein
MSQFKLVKAMNSPLSDEEEEQILSWWEANPDVPIADVVKKFEIEFNMTITEHAIVKAMMKRQGTLTS